MTSYRKGLPLIFLVFWQTVALCDARGFTLCGTIPIAAGEVATLYIYPEFCFRQLEPYGAARYVDTVQHGSFAFHVSDITQRFYIRLVFSSQENRKHSLQFYLAEPGDDILLTVSDSITAFTGLGAEGFRCQYRLNRMVPVLTDAHRASIRSEGGRLSPTDSLVQIVSAVVADSVGKAQLALLNTYRDSLSHDSYTQLYIDYTFKLPAKQVKALNTLLSGFVSDRATKNWIHGIIYRFWLPRLGYAAGVEGPLLVKSSSFTDFALQILYSQHLVTLGNRESTDVFAEMKARLDATFTGYLQEHLLVALMVRYFKGNVNTGLLTGLRAKSFKNPAHTLIVYQVMAAKATGQPAYPFALTDQHGTLVRLDDFARKVLVLDFWFTGCIWCKALEKKMKPIKAALHADSRIIFLSVNLDKDRDIWLRSMSRDEYTDRMAINLFTEGLGFRHPFPAYYGFMGAPQQLIFDTNHELVSHNADFDETEFIDYLKGLAQRASP